MVAAGGGGGGGHSGSDSGTNILRSGFAGGNGDKDGTASYGTYDGQPGKKGELSKGGKGCSGGKYSLESDTDDTYYPSAGGGGGGYYGGGGGGSGRTMGGDYNKAGNSGRSGTSLNGGNGGYAAYTYSIYAWWVTGSAGGGGGSSFIDKERVHPLKMLSGSSIITSLKGVNKTGNQGNGALRISTYKNKQALLNELYYLCYVLKVIDVSLFLLLSSKII